MIAAALSALLGAAVPVLWDKGEPLRPFVLNFDQRLGDSNLVVVNGSVPDNSVGVPIQCASFDLQALLVVDESLHSGELLIRPDGAYHSILNHRRVECRDGCPLRHRLSDRGSADHMSRGTSTVTPTNGAKEPTLDFAVIKGNVESVAVLDHVSQDPSTIRAGRSNSGISGQSLQPVRFVHLLKVRVQQREAKHTRQVSKEGQPKQAARPYRDFLLSAQISLIVLVAIASVCTLYGACRHLRTRKDSVVGAILLGIGIIGVCGAGLGALLTAFFVF